MTLEEAENKADEEATAARQLRWSTTTNLLTALDLIDHDPNDTAANYDPEVAKQSGQKITRARLEQAAAYFTTLAAHWK
jgi:hypothetical protein